jgi:hypothetical protein
MIGEELKERKICIELKERKCSMILCTQTKGWFYKLDQTLRMEYLQSNINWFGKDEVRVDTKF